MMHRCMSQFFLLTVVIFITFTRGAPFLHYSQFQCHIITDKSHTGINRYVLQDAQGSFAETGCSPNTTTAACSSLSDAVNNANQDDVVFIGPGYFTAWSMTAANLTVIGAGMNETVIDGGGGGSIMFYADGYFVMRDLTLRNAYRGTVLWWCCVTSLNWDGSCRSEISQSSDGRTCADA